MSSNRSGRIACELAGLQPSRKVQVVATEPSPLANQCYKMCPAGNRCVLTLPTHSGSTKMHTICVCGDRDCWCHSKERYAHDAKKEEAA